MAPEPSSMVQSFSPHAQVEAEISLMSFESVPAIKGEIDRTRTAAAQVASRLLVFIFLMRMKLRKRRLLANAFLRRHRSFPLIRLAGGPEGTPGVPDSFFPHANPLSFSLPSLM